MKEAIALHCPEKTARRDRGQVAHAATANGRKGNYETPFLRLLKDRRIAKVALHRYAAFGSHHCIHSMGIYGFLTPSRSRDRRSVDAMLDRCRPRFQHRDAETSGIAEEEQCASREAQSLAYLLCDP
jgi:hypothetical protein